MSVDERRLPPMAPEQELQLRLRGLHLLLRIQEEAGAEPLSFDQLMERVNREPADSPEALGAMMIMLSHVLADQPMTTWPEHRAAHPGTN